MAKKWMICALSIGNYQQNIFCVEPFAFMASREIRIAYTVTDREFETASGKVDLQKFTYLLRAELRSFCHSPDQIPHPMFYKFSDDKQRKKYSYSELSCLQIN